jgi:hypothetical protein
MGFQGGREATDSDMNFPALKVTGIQTGTLADGVLKEGDLIRAINGVWVENLFHDECIALMRQGDLTFRIKRDIRASKLPFSQTYFGPTPSQQESTAHPAILPPPPPQQQQQNSDDEWKASDSDSDVGGSAPPPPPPTRSPSNFSPTSPNADGGLKLSGLGISN